MHHILGIKYLLPNVLFATKPKSNVCRLAMMRTIVSIIAILRVLNCNSRILLGVDWITNIAYTESSSHIEAKTSGCEEIGIKIAYLVVDTYHSLCLDRKDIMLSQIEACERLLKLTNEERDKSAIIKEIAELKMTLDLLS